MSKPNQKDHQRLLKCTEKIGSFSNAFAPFFDILGLLGDVRPHWLGWFWGLLQLVFKVRKRSPTTIHTLTFSQSGIRYVLFLEQASDMIRAIAYGLPCYRDRLEPCTHSFRAKRSDWLVSLSYIYADIVQLLLELYCMFSRESKGTLISIHGEIDRPRRPPLRLTNSWKHFFESSDFARRSRRKVFGWLVHADICPQQADILQGLDCDITQ